MAHRVKLLAIGLAMGTASVAALPAAAQAYSANYVFGDSLSDQGNLAEALKHNFPSPPFANDSFTNGSVAVAILSQRLGLSSNPSLFYTGFTDYYKLGLTPGDNYAVAGSTAGNLAGVAGGNLGSQVDAFLGHGNGMASSSALYTLFIGGNDVRTAAHLGDTGYLDAGITAEKAALSSLYNAGARNFLVVNVPNIGIIPEFALGYPTQVDAATKDTQKYNADLADGVSTFLSTSAGARVTSFDLYAFQASLLANAGALGLTNTTQPCYISYGGVTTAPSLTINPACGAIDPATGQASNIASFAFWDPIHPTAVVQAAVGNALADAVLASAVPEPSVWATMILGLGVAGGALRRRGRRAADRVGTPAAA